MIKKLTKGIEESRKEKERLVEEKEKLQSTFKEIEQKAFTVQENYKKTQEVSFVFVYACSNHIFDNFGETVEWVFSMTFLFVFLCS